MVARIRERPLMGVIGPSGVGKSSLVRAGLIPALRRGAVNGSERWFVVEMIPGARPFEEILCGAAAVFPRGRVPKDRAARQRALDRIGERGEDRLSKLDDRFFELEDSHRTYLERYYRRYVEAHPREFFRGS